MDSEEIFILSLFVIVVLISIFRFAGRRKGRARPPKSHEEMQDVQLKEIKQIHTIAPSELKSKYMVFALETTGFPSKRSIFIKDVKHWPHILQIAWRSLDEDFNVLSSYTYYIAFKGSIPSKVSKLNNITRELLVKNGTDAVAVLSHFLSEALSSEYLVGHNTDEKLKIIQANLYRHGFGTPLERKRTICTMETSRVFVHSYDRKTLRLKSPTLVELYESCFIHVPMNNNFHNAEFKAEAISSCFQVLIEKGIISPAGHQIDFNINLRKRVQKYRSVGRQGIIYPDPEIKRQYLSPEKREIINEFVTSGAKAERDSDLAAAADYYSKAIDAGAHSEAIYNRLMLIYKSQNQTDKVISVINKCLDEFEDSKENGKDLDKFYEYLEVEHFVRNCEKIIISE